MSNIITVKIDVTLIDKARLFKGSKANKKNIMPQYLDLILIPKKSQSSFGDQRDEQTHMVCQSVSKQEREAGQQGEILGNAVERQSSQARSSSAPVQSTKEEQESSDDVPF